MLRPVQLLGDLNVTRSTTGRRPWLLPFVLLSALALLLGACGSDDDSGDSGSSGDSTAELQDATLVLDFIPGAVHAGIYDAVEHGHYKDNGINLKIIEPTLRVGRRNVVWSHPAFANRRVFARNDREIVCVDLSAAPDESAGSQE